MEEIKIFEFNKEKVKNAIGGLNDLKPLIQNILKTADYEGKGNEDAVEFGEHIDIAVNAMKVILRLIEYKESCESM